MVKHLEPVNLNYVLAEMEFNLIQRALKASLGNRSKAADLLMIPRTTLVMKMKKLGLLEVDYTKPSNEQRDKH